MGKYRRVIGASIPRRDRDRPGDYGASQRESIRAGVDGAAQFDASRRNLKYALE
jgi:hypothetical protein